MSVAEENMELILWEGFIEEIFNEDGETKFRVHFPGREETLVVGASDLQPSLSLKELQLIEQRKVEANGLVKGTAATSGEKFESDEVQDSGSVETREVLKRKSVTFGTKWARDEVPDFGYDSSSEKVVHKFTELRRSSHKIQPTSKNKDVTKAVQKVAAAYDCKIVEGVLSHQLKQFVIDGNKVILSVTSPDTKVDDAEFEENEVYAVDIVASTGDGKPKLLDEKQTTIYKRAVDKSYHLKMKASRFIFSEISQNFPIMPFTARALDEKRARLGLVECVNHELLQPYPVLHEKPGLSFYTSEKEAAGTALKEMNGKIINWWMIMVDVAKTNPPKYSRGSPRPRY